MEDVTRKFALEKIFVQSDIRIGQQIILDQSRTVFAGDLSWNCGKIRLIARELPDSCKIKFSHKNSLFNKYPLVLSFYQ